MNTSHLPYQEVIKETPFHPQESIALQGTKHRFTKNDAFTSISKNTFTLKWLHGFTITVSCFKRESYVESKKFHKRELTDKNCPSELFYTEWKSQTNLM